MPEIRMKLSPSSIDSAIRQIEAYSRSLDAKAERLRRMVAEQIMWSAQDGFSNAMVSDIFTGAEPPISDVQVSVTDSGDVTLVIADGEQAVYVEFGAGVYHNGAAGQSPIPKGADNGFLIGEYGKGQGKRNTWALPGSTHDAPILTHGTPAAMPMYHGVQDALAVIADLAREAFSA